MKLSVCVITYNHAPFIGRCLNSVLGQEIPCEFELIVADDCSTDGTSDIVDQIARQDPRVRVLRPDRNIGGTRNFLALHNAAQGEFVANVDGDDFCAPRKFIEQLKLLESRPELSACGHRMQFVDEKGQPIDRSFPIRLAPTTSLEDVVRWGMPFSHSSLMYRRSARTFSSADFDVFDWYFLTDILRSGAAGYVDESLGFYTIHGGSTTVELKRRGLREGLLANYAKRVEQLPRLRPDVFCFAVAAAISCVRRGDPVTALHKRLLYSCFTPQALAKLPGTIYWHFSNNRALSLPMNPADRAPVGPPTRGGSRRG